MTDSVKPRSRAEILDYLSSFDLFKGNEQEGLNYVHAALGRFLITIKMLPPAQRPGARLLELGAGPYFITLLLKQYHAYELTLANYFGSDHHPPQGVQTMSSERYGETHSFHYDYFNVEFAEYPYPDNSFDVVLFCEILEHLTEDPTHVLSEIHRVLRPGGHVLITTPNMLRWEHFRDLALGKNIHDPYSGYGVYGRHNREYAPQEVIRLLEECGFSVQQARLANVHNVGWDQHLASALRSHWRDHMFFLAAADRPRRYRYAPWLYRSMIGPRRFLDAEVQMGTTDERQTGAGWYDPDLVDGSMRWTRQDAVTYLRARGGETSVEVDLNPGPAGIGPVTVTLRLGDATLEVQPPPDAWTTCTLPIPPCAPGATYTFVISVGQLRIPKQLGYNEDGRELGVLVRRIALTQPAAETPHEPTEQSA